MEDLFRNQTSNSGLHKQLQQQPFPFSSFSSSLFPLGALVTGCGAFSLPANETLQTFMCVCVCVFEAH